MLDVVSVKLQVLNIQGIPLLNINVTSHHFPKGDRHDAQTVRNYVCLPDKLATCSNRGSTSSNI